MGEYNCRGCLNSKPLKHELWRRNRSRGGGEGWMKGRGEEKKESVTISLLINIRRVPSEDTESSLGSLLPVFLWLIWGDNGPLRQTGKHLSHGWLQLNYTNKCWMQLCVQSPCKSFWLLFILQLEFSHYQVPERSDVGLFHERLR